MKTLLNALCITLILVSTGAQALEKDPKNRRVTVKGGEIYKGGSPEPYNVIMLYGLGEIGVARMDIASALAGIANIGGDTLGFELKGISPDGKTFDSAALNSIELLKKESSYCWSKLFCRVLTDFGERDHETRLAAVKTAAEVLKGQSSILYWIDGPKSAELVAAFKEIAPQLTVVSPHGGDVDAIINEHSKRAGRPAMMIGGVPKERGAHFNSLEFDSCELLDYYDALNAVPLEFEKWTPTTEGLTQAEIDEGFYTLFYRNDMSNWTVMGDKKDGFIEHWGGISWNGKGGRRVQSRKRYGNFILRLEWKLQRRHGNSGVFIRAPRVNRESALGMEIQVFGDPGEAPNKNSSGSIYDVLAATSNPTNPIGDWNTYEIYANGDHIRVTINGTVVQDVNIQDHEKLIPRLKKGFIKLQDHNDEVTFRHIRIKELP